MTDRLKDRVVVVVGAGSSGSGMSNGRAASVLFARHGAKVFAIDQHVESMRETCAAVEREGATVDSAVCDIRDSARVRAAIDQCVSRFGTVDALYNNVGVASTGGVCVISDEEWDRVVDINVIGLRNTCRAVLPVMEAKGRGSIVNVSSLLSRLTLRRIHNVAYTASKAALEAMTRDIAIEYAPKGVRANNLILGLIDTPQIRANYERRRAIPGNEAEADRIWLGRSMLPPLGRQGTPWEVANAALFLLSDESSYITGANLVIDGGLANLLD